MDDSCFEAAASNDSGILGASVAPCTVVGADGQYLNSYHEFWFDSSYRTTYVVNFIRQKVQIF